ncbi:MAG TPA: dihydrofolate reductase family protein [Terriglobales bacterium]
MPAPITISIIHLAPVAWGCTNGCSAHAPFDKWWERMAALRVLTTILSHVASTTSERGSWVGTCLDRSEGLGQTTVWKGWWGDNPPFHTPVFVLTNHPRASIDMSGGTTFHLVTDGIHAALERAVDAANGQDARLGGGVAAVRQYLRAGLIDEMHLVMSPVLLGAGECILEGIDATRLGYECTEHVPTPNATHFVITKRT